MIKKKVYKSGLVIIVLNKCVCYEYFIEDEYEVGFVLQGWEVKFLCVGKVNIGDSYVILKDGEVFLFGVNFMFMVVVFIYYVCDLMCICKLLFNQCELDMLYGCINCEGYIVVVLLLYWKNVWCKVKIGVVKGKKQYDKCIDLKDCEWVLDKVCIMKYVGC